jgi:hypothetical protein
MSANKPVWTSPGTTDSAAYDAAEARKGTAAANPVLSLAPSAPPGSRRAGAPVRASHHGAGGQAADTRSPADIEAEIEQTRDRLAGTLDELSERLSPRAALRRANSAAHKAFTTPDGAVRKDRAAIVAGALAAAVGGAVALRMRRRR